MTDTTGKVAAVLRGRLRIIAEEMGKMHTKDRLAAELRGIGLNEMADKAATGYYHDFLSPLDLPEMVLVNDLTIAELADDQRDRAVAISALRKRVINGDFDASTEESEEWANSAEGKDAMRRLCEGR
jgi:hypothetical protein